MAAVARLALLAPHLYHTAAALVYRHQEIGVHRVAVAERSPRQVASHHVPRGLVDFGQTLVLFWTLGKLRHHLLKAHVVNLTHKLAVPPTGVAHIEVGHEHIGQHGRSPAVLFLQGIVPAVPLAHHRHTADEELAHGETVHLVHLVHLHHIFQQGVQCLGLRLLVAVSRRAARLRALVDVGAYHVAHQAADEVVLQRHLPLHLDVLLLGHHLAVHTHHVAPLVAVGVAFVALALAAEAVARRVVALRLHEYLLATAPLVAVDGLAAHNAVGAVLARRQLHAAQPV